MWRRPAERVVRLSEHRRGYDEAVRKGTADTPAPRTRAWIGVVVLGLLTGCAPQAPDHSSWRDQAHLSVQDVASNVATMSLVLRLVREGRMFGKYQQVVALNSETNAGRTTSHLSAEQPEPRDDPTYKRVTGVLSDAGDLLAEVRIALVRRDAGAYAHLAGDLADMTRRLQRVETAVAR
jgi:hypothetical protein